MILSFSKFKIVGTLLVKNEGDILQKNIEHHLEHGISRLIVTDNNSTDGSRKIIEKYKEVSELIDEKGDNHNQSSWVTRMARLACRLSPDWIVHLDADELWCGLPNLRFIDAKAVSSNQVFIHPPRPSFSIQDMRYYLDFKDFYDLDNECKVAHRPIEDVIINHGNHGLNTQTLFTKDIWRHHFPIRSYDQFERKTKDGHLALQRRNSFCPRWKRWFETLQEGKLKSVYDDACREWQLFIDSPNHDSLLKLLGFWSEPDVISFFRNLPMLPKVGQWPMPTNV